MKGNNVVAVAMLVTLGAIPGWSRDASRSPLRMVTQDPDYRLEFFPRFFAEGQRPLALALGGGAAKGIAHLGVLQRLQEEGLPVSGIAGTSMGALVGSMYVTGYSGFAIQSVLEEVDLGALLLDRQHRIPGKTLWEQENERVTFLSLEVEPGHGVVFSPGTSSGYELKLALQILLGRGALGADASFDHLRVPFRAVASNLQTGRATAPDGGELATVVRASMSVPGLFSPVILGDHQLVDGMLVQNLPVETARSLVPSALVMAVEVGKGLDEVRQNSILGLAFRSLDVSIEERTEISRKASDILVRPNTDPIEYLEFHKQVRLAVEEGRRAFDQRLEALEGGLYGPDGNLPAPTGPLAIEGPEELGPRLRALVQDNLPDGPRLRRHYGRLLRRLLASGIVSQAEVRFPPEGPRLAVTAQPVLDTVELQAPGSWRDLARQHLEEEGLRPGARWNPMALGRALDHFYLTALLRGHPMITFQGTGFDSGARTLRVKVQEFHPERIRVQPGILPPAQTRYLQRVFAPYEDAPTDARTFARDLGLAERRLGLKELRLEKGEGPGRALRVTPVPDNRTIIDAVFAYESTWQAQGALSIQANRVFGTEFGLGARGSANAIQTALALDLSRPLGAWPRIGWRITGAETALRLRPETLRFPFTPSTLPVSMANRTLRERSLGLGLFARVGMDDRGLLSLDYSHRWNDIQPAPQVRGNGSLDQAQAMFEWDSFDRYLFPTQGLLLRMKVAEGRQTALDPAAGTRTYQAAYLRLRHLWPLGAWASLEGDLETGLGWNLPLARWYSTGGPAFFAGTSSGTLFTPNFAAFRLGLPLKVGNAFGVNFQICPRVDVGYLGAGSPGQLTSAPLVRGAGASLRSEIGRWFCEVAVGRWFLPGGSPFEKTRVSVLLGAHPLDLWRNP